MFDMNVWMPEMTMQHKWNKSENVGIFSNWYDNLDSDFVDYNPFEGNNFTCDINIVNADNIGPKTDKRWKVSD